MEIDKYLTVLFPLGSSLLTGVFALLGVWFANRSSLKQLTLRLDHEAERDNKELIRDRLEEMYALFEGWVGHFVGYHYTYRRVMDGHISYNDAMSITLESGRVQDAKRLFALADIYFPDARPSFKEVINLRDKASVIFSQFTEFYREEGVGSPNHSKAITRVLNEFNLAAEKYKTELLAYVKEI